MKRLSFALILAISIHAVFFFIKIDISQVHEIVPESEPIKIKMAFRKKVKPEKKQLQKIEQNQKNTIEQLKVKEKKTELKEVKPVAVVKKSESKIKKELKQITAKKEVPEKKVKKFKTVKKPEQKIKPAPEIKPQFKQDQKLEEPLLVSKKLIDPDQKRVPEPTANESNAKSPPLFPGKIQPGPAAVHTKATPKYKTNPQPLYPRIAKRRGYQGRVLLLVVVSKSGTVKELSVSKSSRYDILDKAACEAVKKWYFYPGTRDGKPVEMSVTIPIRFDIQQ